MKKIDTKDPEARIVFIGPCTAKKMEVDKYGKEAPPTNSTGIIRLTRAWAHSQ